MAKINLDGVVGSGVFRLTLCAALALCFLVSCGGDSSSNSDESISDNMDPNQVLPECNLYSEGAMYPLGAGWYVCSGGSWKKTDPDSTKTNIPTKPDSTVDDTTNNVNSGFVADMTHKADSTLTDTSVVDTAKPADTSAVADSNAVADTLKTDSVPEQKPLEQRNVLVAGVAEYGLFDSKSSVVVEELDSTLAKTGVAFAGTVSSKDGSFAIKDAMMKGPYVRVSVMGSASNMALGSMARSNDTLSVIVPIADTVSVNVNALSFLVSERVKTLLEKGTSATYKEAAGKAVGEVWGAFGFDGFKSENPSKVAMANGKESGSALLAVTIMLQAMVSDSVANISSVAKIFAEGNLGDSKVLAKMADWSLNEDMSDEYDEVKNNVKKQGFATVPEFESVLKAFYLAELDIEDCDESMDGKIVFAKNEHSAYYASSYSDPTVTKERIKCDAGTWNIATDKEKDTYGFDDAASGDVRQGLINQDLVYSYNGSSWRLVTSRTSRDAFFVQKSNIQDFVDLQTVYESIKDDERVIFVLRHGERDKDKTSKGDPLSVNGYNECVNVGKNLTKFSEPFRLGASEFYRAQQTSIGIAEGRGQDTTVADTFAFLNDDWYMIDRNLVNQAEDKSGGGWEATSLYVYDGMYPEAYYNLADRSAQLIDTLLTTYANVPDRFIMLSSHDKLMVPFVAYCSNLKINMNVKNGGTWINYLAGIAIIWDKTGNRRYVAVKGLESAYFRGWNG